MDWTQAVDIYCERTDPSFWAEPLNAWSNLAFVLASAWAGFEAYRRKITDPAVWVLICLAALIGPGSFLFHTFGQVWSSFADTIPIWTFVAAFVGVAMHRIGGVRPGRIGVIALGTVAMIVVMTLAADDGSTGAHSHDPLNGSGQYAPALLALLVFALLTQWRKHPGRQWIMAALVTFTLSLGFRTVDMMACASLPIGTHFVWHLLNGLMIGLLLQMLVRVIATPKDLASD